MTVNITEDVFGISKDPFTEEHKTIRRFTFKNSNNVSVQIITLGATVTSINVPDECGKIEDVVCGFDDVAGYQSTENPYFGATIGRVCNRIGYGRFKLNGIEINVNKNLNGKHQLHGGYIGFDKVHWIPQIIKNDTIIMTHISDDGHEGYPGELHVCVSFKLTMDNSFHVNFTATTNMKTSVVNLTNHSYFNLAGHSAGKEELYNHYVKIKADRITETDDDSIPTGVLKNITSTCYDLQELDLLGDKLKKLPVGGFDDNYCVNLNDNKTTIIAKVWHQKSGRWMEIASDQPGVQFYTSNGMPDPDQKQNPIIGKNGAKYFKHAALCLETQKYPDAVNHENFPSIIINPGETYKHEVIYKFGACKNDKNICAQQNLQN